MSIYRNGLKEAVLRALDEQPEGLTWDDLNKKIGYKRNASTPYSVISELEREGKVRRVKIVRKVRRENMTDYRRSATVRIERIRQ